MWVVGHRGIYLYDQSGVFDGAWRMLQGQVLYRDFYAPYGPVVFWIQSLFFRLAGVDFSSMVLSAAVINSVAIVCVIWLVRRLFPKPLHRPTAIGAGLLTAVWFQAPFGTLWFEQTSFCFNLVAMVLLVETGFWSERTCSLSSRRGRLLTSYIRPQQTERGCRTTARTTRRRCYYLFNWAATNSRPTAAGIRRHLARGCRICAVVVECFVSDGFLAIRCCDVPCVGRSPHRSRD